MSQTRERLHSVVDTATNKETQENQVADRAVFAAINPRAHGSTSRTIVKNPSSYSLHWASSIIDTGVEHQDYQGIPLGFQCRVRFAVTDRRAVFRRHLLEGGVHRHRTPTPNS
jgi:hypothetical protein